MNPRLYISHDTGLDWLMAFEFGRVDDAQPPDSWEHVSGQFAFLRDAPGGRVVGFRVAEFSIFDPDDEDYDGIWDEPRFDAPLLALSDASAAEIVVAARAHFDGRDSLNRRLFSAATNTTGEEALVAWRHCLESGDAMAHFGLGYTLFELGRHAEAYRHLRHYTEIAPHGAWNWCWYGYAAEAIGEVTEARRAYRRAIELERAGDHETDAAERLERLAPTAGASETGRDRAPASAAAGGPGPAVSQREREAGPTVQVRDVPARIRGCLLGGAVGDALGAAVEFDSIERIRERFGPQGITDFAPAYGRLGAITDDTQMTLFTAEGLLRAYARAVSKGISHAPGVVDHAYARWLATQGERSRRWIRDDGPDGWLIGVTALHDRRAPGNTCLAAMRAERPGSVEQPLNDSKGCGGVMRVAPAGLMGRAYGADVFELGRDTAALTHGHPSGYLAAGAMAGMVARLLRGAPLDEALNAVEAKLAEYAGHEETLTALRAARALAASEREPAPEAIATLGEGWVAEEALAIAVYCALVAKDFAHGVRLAVNHSGDSDSTGAITGNILGVMLGVDAIPRPFLDRLELREEIEQLASDWIACFGPEPTADVESEAWRARYPGW
jgi:ADP-ribosyl-[dinitrogen reductase] hydrolase